MLGIMARKTPFDELRRAILAKRRADIAQLRAANRVDQEMINAVQAIGRGGQVAVAAELGMTREGVRLAPERIAARTARLAELEPDDREGEAA